MIIFLYGEDSYRSRQKLNEIIVRHQELHKSGLNLIQLDAEEINFSDFSDKFKISSMFAEKKLIILKNIFSNKKFQEEFLKESKNLLESKEIILIFEEEKVDERNKFFKFLKKEAQSQEFKLLGGEKLKNWVKKEVEKYQAEIKPESLKLLIEYLGNDSWGLVNEIKKLVNYKRKIGREDIMLLVRPKIETDIFKTIDAISQKNKKQALELLHKHLEKGDSPLYLLSMINFQFRNLLIVKDLMERRNPYNMIVKKSGLHPFVVKKSYFQSQKFTLEELKKIYRKIFQVDLDIKTGKIKPELALEMLITQLYPVRDQGVSEKTQVRQTSNGV